MKKFFSLILTALMVFALAGCSSLDKDAVKAPVVGYLDALKAGDLNKALEYESPDYSNGAGEAAEAFNNVISSAGLGEKFESEASGFLKNWIQKSFQEYTIGDITEADDKDTAYVMADVTGIPLDEEEIEALMNTAIVEPEGDLTEYAENLTDVSDMDKIYGDIAEMLYDKLNAKLDEMTPQTETMRFTVKKDDSGNWLIANVEVEEK